MLSVLFVLFALKHRKFQSNKKKKSDFYYTTCEQDLSYYWHSEGHNASKSLLTFVQTKIICPISCSSVPSYKSHNKGKIIIQNRN